MLKVLKYFGETLEELGDLPGAVEKYEEAMTAKGNVSKMLD